MCECSCNRLKSCENEPKPTGPNDLFTGFPVEPIDFSTAQVGDTLRCVLNGDVKVDRIMQGDKYCLVMKLNADEPGRFATYMTNGFHYEYNITPALIGWVDSNGKLCRTRPEPHIDWSKVKVDTPVERTDRRGNKEKLHFSGEISPITHSPRFWCEGKTSHTTIEKESESGATYKIINTETKEK